MLVIEFGRLRPNIPETPRPSDGKIAEFTGNLSGNTNEEPTSLFRCSPGCMALSSGLATFCRVCKDKCGNRHPDV